MCPMHETASERRNQSCLQSVQRGPETVCRHKVLGYERTAPLRLLRCEGRKNRGWADTLRNVYQMENGRENGQERNRTLCQMRGTFAGKF